MWIKCNINPLGKDVGDCVVRAVGIATDRTWHSVYDDLCDAGHRECDMPNSDPVWGKYLFQQGFDPFILPQRCPQCLTVEQFCKVYPRGVYIIGTGTEQYPLTTRCCAPVTACGVRTRTKYATRVVTSAAGAAFRMLVNPACTPDYSLESINGTAPAAASTNGAASGN